MQASCPLELADGEAGGGGGAGEAYEVLRPDVRHEEREADREPPHRPAREEEVVGMRARGAGARGVALLEEAGEADRGDADKVEHDEHHVDRRELDRLHRADARRARERAVGAGEMFWFAVVSKCRMHAVLRTLK